MGEGSGNREERIPSKYLMGLRTVQRVVAATFPRTQAMEVKLDSRPPKKCQKTCLLKSKIEVWLQNSTSCMTAINHYHHGLLYSSDNNQIHLILLTAYNDSNRFQVLIWLSEITDIPLLMDQYINFES